MVNEFEIKKQICDIGRRIYNRNMEIGRASCRERVSLHV